ncbi:hypothetical protein N7449_011375 [Penicillium cf. viridicatum]|uniref:Uncharacterized protein n=1 Tax=Penicillium cf. viridicatum TaxID=2972119 RepID=A0A9W9M1Y7_9EURO|nr:hypothetical protein N7449_011375 [Penicillium cf. viridicatum]
MPTAKFVNDNITVSEESDVKLTLDDENNTDEPLTLLCPGETKKNFTGKIVSIEPYGTYSTRSWRLSEDVDFAVNRDVTVTDQALEQGNKVVAIRVISGIGADDIRSNDGGEGEEDLEYEAAQLLEVEVEDIDLKRHLLCNPWLN